MQKAVPRLTCPACRAANDAGPNCRRCKADLALLVAVEDRRDFLLADARRAASEGRLVEAEDSITQADGLRHGADVKQLLAAVRLLRGDFAGAWAIARDAVP